MKMNTTVQNILTIRQPGSGLFFTSSISDQDAAALERLRQQERAAPSKPPAANRTPHWRDKTKDPIGSDGKGGIRIEHPRPRSR